jgi:hypothetical protein
LSKAIDKNEKAKSRLVEKLGLSKLKESFKDYFLKNS